MRQDLKVVDLVHLVHRIRVGRLEILRQGGQNDVPHLNELLRNVVTEGKREFTQELREVVQQNEENPKSAFVEVFVGLLADALLISDFLEELHQGRNQVMEFEVDLHFIAVQNDRHEVSVADQF